MYVRAQREKKGWARSGPIGSSLGGVVGQGQSPGSRCNAGIGSSRDVVQEELSIHEVYQQMDEGTEKSLLSTGERNRQEEGQVSGPCVSKSWKSESLSSSRGKVGSRPVATAGAAHHALSLWTASYIFGAGDHFDDFLFQISSQNPFLHIQLPIGPLYLHGKRNSPAFPNPLLFLCSLSQRKHLFLTPPSSHPPCLFSCLLNSSSFSPPIFTAKVLVLVTISSRQKFHCSLSVFHLPLHVCGLCPSFLLNATLVLSLLLKILHLVPIVPRIKCKTY